MPDSKLHETKKWDVAISFLIQDITIAETLYVELSKGLQVFFSPRRQEEIAGTDGMEVFRKTFLTDSRLNVVVYRERWGTTPWTAVEANAIRDSCVKNQFRNIFVFNVENTRAFPDWLPYNHMRFDLGEYTLDQVVGAIKLRVAEQGGHFEPMTPQKQALAMRAEQEYHWARSSVRSSENWSNIATELERLFQHLELQCREIESAASVDLEYEIIPKQSCVLRCEQVGMVIRWNKPYGNTFDESSLRVETYDGHLRFSRDQSDRFHYFHPQLLTRIDYDPDLSRTRNLGWKLAGRSEDFIPSEALAEKCLMEFLQLIAKRRAERG